MTEGGQRRIVMHCPDITLKGRNEKDFRAALGNNVRLRLRALGLDWPVKIARGRVYVDPPDDLSGALPLSQVVDALKQIAGVDTLAAAIWLRPMAVGLNGEINRDLIEQHMVALAKQNYHPGQVFAVRVNRSDKRVALRSKEMEVWLGDAIRAQSDWDKVNLKYPDARFHVDIYPDGMYLYPGKIKAGGGLPVGTGGRVLSLLSGGIDSPVASYLMARRGCEVDFFHMTASHMGIDELQKSTVARLAQRLSQYTLRSRIYFAPYTHFDLALMQHDTRYGLVLFRRFMARVAEKLAESTGAAALVSGDSLGQVASQTLSNLVSQDRSVESLVLRPLVGFNKQEIIAIAREIGTYEISIEPYKDCCALLSANPKTRSKPAYLGRIEQEVFNDYAVLIDETLSDLTVLEYRCGELCDVDRL